MKKIIGFLSWLGQWYLANLDPEFSWRFKRIERMRREGVSRDVINAEIDKLSDYVKRSYPRW